MLPLSGSYETAKQVRYHCYCGFTTLRLEPRGPAPLGRGSTMALHLQLTFWCPVQSLLAHTQNTSISKAEAGGSPEVQGQSGLQKEESGSGSKQELDVS